MDNYKVIFLQARAVENILRLIKKWSNSKFDLCDRTHDNNNMFNLYSAFTKLKDAVQKQKHNRQSIHIIVTVLSQSINRLCGQ